MIASMMAGPLDRKGMRHPAVLLRDHGRTMKFDAAKTYEGKRGQQHMCFMNAGRLALDGNGTYCEGYVSIHGVPVEHAWVLRKGLVIDPTITSAKGIDEYYGISIKTDYLRTTILRTKMWGVLSPMTNKDILTDDPKDILA